MRVLALGKTIDVYTRDKTTFIGTSAGSAGGLLCEGGVFTGHYGTSTVAFKSSGTQM